MNKLAFPEEETSQLQALYKEREKLINEFRGGRRGDDFVASFLELQRVISREENGGERDDREIKELLSCFQRGNRREIEETLGNLISS